MPSAQQSYVETTALLRAIKELIIANKALLSAIGQSQGSAMSIGDPKEIANAAVLLQKAARKNKTRAAEDLSNIKPLLEDSSDELKVATPTVNLIKPGSGAKW